MKRLFLLLLTSAFIVLATSGISAFEKNKDLFIKDSFVKSVDDALLEDHHALTAKVSPFMKMVRDKNVPNCFECSLYLIRATLNSDGETQLVAADLAVKFSPDLPEAHLHLFMRLLKFSPLSGGRIAKSFNGTLKTFFNFPPRDAFFYSVFNRISKGCIIFLIIFLVILLFKYPSALLHRYMHLVGFSRFYAFTLFLALGVSSFILVTNQLSWIIVLITFSMFMSGVTVIREKVVIQIVLAVCIFSEAAIILTGANESSTIDKKTALMNFKAIYSPVSIDLDRIKTEVSGGNMAKGAMFYYRENFSRAAFYFKRELKTVSDEKIKASIDNFLGLSFAREGNFKEAAEHLKASYEATGNFKTGYNLARILYESGNADEATILEKHILENAGSITLKFPYHYYPEMYRMWRYLLSGKTGDSFEAWVKVFLYLLAITLLYIILLLIRMNYLRKIKLDKCLECGSVICSSCNPASNTSVCVVCRLMKAKPELFKKGENIVYENSREAHFSRYSIFTTIFTFITPGGGLVFSDRIIEGSVYLFTVIFIITQVVEGKFGMFYNIDPGSGNSLIIFFAIISGLIYLLSVIRSFFASRNL